jgi:hypothetical protein
MYTCIIKKLFSSEEGYNGVKKKIVQCNDPNSLVDRLRLLLAFQKAGDINVSYEILLISEYLKKAKIIKNQISFKEDIAREIHYPARKKFNRLVINVYCKNDLW